MSDTLWQNLNGGVNFNNIREPSLMRAVTSNDLILLRKGQKNYAVVKVK